MSENKKSTETKKESPFKPVSRNLPMWDHEKEPTIIGLFMGSEILGADTKDKEGNSKAFKVFVVTNLETGEDVHISSAYSIEKALESEGAIKGETVFQITFLGKTEVKGKPFNRFDIYSCSLKEYEVFNK